MAEGDRPAANLRLSGTLVTDAGPQPITWTIPEERPVALRYNGQPHAVMMATPADLEDFAVGFSLSESIVDGPQEIEDIAVATVPDGIEIDIRIWPKRFERLEMSERKRVLAGRSGCGLCGLDSLSHVVASVPPVARAASVPVAAIVAAGERLFENQPLNKESFSVHGAAWVTRDGTIAHVREDIGRHNALDKLIGVIASLDVARGDGFVLLTSRCGYELALKAARCSLPVVVSISAPTAMAIRFGEASGVTLASFAPEGIVVFTHPHRIPAAQRVTA